VLVENYGNGPQSERCPERRRIRRLCMCCMTAKGIQEIEMQKLAPQIEGANRDLYAVWVQHRMGHVLVSCNARCTRHCTPVRNVFYDPSLIREEEGVRRASRDQHHTDDVPWGDLPRGPHLTPTSVLLHTLQGLPADVPSTLPLAFWTSRGACCGCSQHNAAFLALSRHAGAPACVP
jgi:hypothetical protein